MAPSPVMNASSSLSPHLSPYHPPQPIASQFGGFNQNQWGPGAIGTVFFGIVMFLIGVTALWQGRLRTMRHEEDEERGRRSCVGDRPADPLNAVAMVDLAEGIGNERVAMGTEEDHREDDMMEGGFARIERAMRTETEGTLVGGGDDKVGVKGLED